MNKNTIYFCVQLAVNRSIIKYQPTRRRDTSPKLRAIWIALCQLDTAEYIGAKIEGKVKTIKFLSMLDRTKVELILAKNGYITLKHYTENKC